MPETSNVDYSTKIPNNVGLTDDQRVLKALEQWHPGYIDWWMTMGPEGFQTSDVYLRTAISIDPKGWAKFDYVKMPEYRWGILLAPRQEDRQVNFGTHKGEKAWQEVPGEYRAMLRRLDRRPGRHRARQRRAAAPPRQDRAVALRHAQPVPGQRRGRPPPVGDGLPAAEILRQGRPRGGRGPAAAPLRRRGQAAHARRLQRGDARLAVVLHVHVLHRSRRQDAAGKPGAVGLRSAVAHLPLHADRGSAPHVRRRDRRRPRHRGAPARP